ncbi:MAG: ABC transporter permease, partial [Bacteroidota bacterium]
MSAEEHHPPAIAEKILSKVIKDIFIEEVLGDLEEKFQTDIESKPVWIAKIIYWYQLLNYLKPFAIKRIRSTHSNNITMLKHYIKISWRSLLRDKVFSLIEIGGFAIGIAACILIALFIRYQSGFDSFYQDKDRIFRMVNYWSETGGDGYWSNMHGPLKPLLEEKIPEMELVSRVVLWSWGDAGDNYVRPIAEKYNSYDEGFIYTDPEFLEILETKMIFGDQKEALEKPNSIVITQSKAAQYFPNENPVGKQLILNDNRESVFTIGGVIADFPSNSHIQASFIMTLKDRKKGPGTSGWCCTNYNYYVKLKKGADKLAVQEKTIELRNTFVIDQLRSIGSSGVEEELKYQQYYLQPVENIYLNTEEVGDNLQHGSHDLVFVFGAIALIILFIASINFVNLATAKSIKRAKEVGLRKVVGSVRSTLITQYLIESCFYSFLSVLAGLLIALLALPLFNEVANVSLTIPFTEWWFIPSLLLLSVSIGLLSGLYPAFYLSGFRPVAVLKGKINDGGKTSLIRSGMVVFQFMATVVLIIGAIVTHQQFDFIMNKEIGYDKSQVVTLKGLATIDEKSKLALKTELLRIPAVEAATISSFLPVDGGDIHNRAYWVTEERQKRDGMEAARWTVDEDYIETLQMEIVKGRGFMAGNADANGIIINEKMAAELGLENPVGTQLIDMFDEKRQVIGVVKDFYFESMLWNVRPLAMIKGSNADMLTIKLNSNEVEETLSAVNLVWEKFNDRQLMEYTFMDKSFEHMYDLIQRTRKIFLLFSVLSIVIACMGLFALSVYTVENRSKEISIRKVLGAS